VVDQERAAAVTYQNEMRQRIFDDVATWLSCRDIPLEYKREFMFFLFRLATLRPLLRRMDTDGSMAVMMLRQFMGIYPKK
jgi:hypothetical protein